MRKLLVSISVIFLTIFCLPAIAQSSKGSDPERLATIKSIGVISAVGDQINIYTNGFSIFSLSEKYLSLSDMKIDDALESFVREKIGARFKIAPIQYDRLRFSTGTEPGFMVHEEPPPIADLVKTLADPVDVYLVISKAAVPFGVREDILRPGLNMGKGAGPTYSMYAFMNVSLFDALTHKLIVQAVYPAPISQFWGGTVEMLPLDGSLWPDDAGNFTVAQHDALRGVLITDLTSIVGKGLDQIGLAPPTGQ